MLVILPIGKQFFQWGETDVRLCELPRGVSRRFPPFSRYLIDQYRKSSPSIGTSLTFLIVIWSFHPRVEQ